MVTQTIRVTFELPEADARAAEATGILSPESLARLVQQALQRQADVQRMQEIMDALQSVEPPITPEEIEAEIQAYRAEKRAKRASEEHQ